MSQHPATHDGTAAAMPTADLSEADLAQRPEEHLTQLREILFGSDKAAIEARIHAMEQHIKVLSEALAGERQLRHDLANLFTQLADTLHRDNAAS